jgi:hypothetical protein
VSAAVDARVGATPKLWVAVSTSPKNEVVMLCVFAMIVPFLGYAQFSVFTLCDVLPLLI